MNPLWEELDVGAFELESVVAHFEEHGYARLGRVASDDVLARLRVRAEDLMLGRVDTKGFFFQRDATDGTYDELPYGRGWEGPSLAYRKIDQLGRDPVFREWLGNAMFERVARRVLGAPVFLLRAMLMTKAARGGTPLPWHQDAGRFWGISAPPKLQLWTALDDAPEEAGCVEVFPGSHHAGLVTLQGGVVPREIARERNAETRAVKVPARAGEVILLHNLMWHRSGVNTTEAPRRAFSVCFVDETVRCTRTRKAPREFPLVFGALQAPSLG